MFARNAFKTLLAAGILAVLAWGALWFVPALQPAAGAGPARPFTIAPGTGFRAIGRDLQAQGFVRSAAAFDIYAIVTGRARRLVPGRYELDPSRSAMAISAAIASGPEREATVTIPEGMSLIEIDRILADAGVTPRGAFMNLALAQSRPVEGRLFPDTYRFYFDSDPQEVLDRLLANFDAKAAPLLAADPEHAERDLILASILEKEVRTPEDMRTVAGVLLKRVAAGVPLQVDASLCYIKRGLHPDEPCEPITVLDKKSPSPYNTYLHSGWPPGPIANPGILAIEAALHPMDSPYWYYLSDPATGKTIFARTIEEHVANQLKYLRKN